MLLDRGSVLYLTLYGFDDPVLLLFWVATQFNELQIADDMKKNRRLHPRRSPGTGDEQFSPSHQ